MKPFDSFDHYTEWENNKAWIYNRCLFLIHMQDQANERFHGGDGQTVDEAILNFSDSFAPEHDALLKNYPDLFNKAFGDWINNGNKPRYARV